MNDTIYKVTVDGVCRYEGYSKEIAENVYDNEENASMMGRPAHVILYKDGVIYVEFEGE